jgi:hypothetical protein
MTQKSLPTCELLVILTAPLESETFLNVTKTVVTLMIGTAEEFMFVPLSVTVVPPLHTQET